MNQICFEARSPQKIKMTEQFKQCYHLYRFQKYITPLVNLLGPVTRNYFIRFIVHMMWVFHTHAKVFVVPANLKMSHSLYSWICFDVVLFFQIQYSVLLSAANDNGWNVPDDQQHYLLGGKYLFGLRDVFAELLYGLDSCSYIPSSPVTERYWTKSSARDTVGATFPHHLVWGTSLENMHRL